MIVVDFPVADICYLPGIIRIIFVASNLKFQLPQDEFVLIGLPRRYEPRLGLNWICHKWTCP